MLNASTSQQSRSYKDQMARFMIKHTILTLDLYPILSRQIESNRQMSSKLKADSEQDTNTDSNGLERGRILSSCKRHTHHDGQLLSNDILDEVKKLHRARFVLRMSVYLIELIRYLLIHLISLDALYEYHYLDCFLLGRFRFIGRTNKISSRIMLTFLSGFIMYRYITFVIKPDFKLQIVEFLLYEYKQVVDAETKFKSSQPTGNILNPPARAQYSSADQRVDEIKIGNESGLVEPNPVLYLRNHFDGHSIDSKWILRPNRTSESWIILRGWVRFGQCTLGAVIILFISVSAYSIAGSILTDLGYEIAYPTCVAYIQDKQRAPEASAQITSTLGDNNRTTTSDFHTNELDYSYIYLTPTKMANQINTDWSHERQNT